MNKTERNHRMLTRLCEDDLNIRDINGGGLTNNAILTAVRKQIGDSGIRLENWNKPHTVIEIKSVYQKYKELK